MAARKQSTPRKRRVARPAGMVDRSKGASREERGPIVTSEERHRFAECIAFFQADQYRAALPGTVRENDVDIAQQQIDAILKHCRRS